VDTGQNWRPVRIDTGEVVYIAASDVRTAQSGSHFYVACSNAQTWEKARADVVLSGAADDIQLNALIEANPGCTVTLSSGQVQCVASVGQSSSPNTATRWIGTFNAGANSFTQFIFSGSASSYVNDGTNYLLFLGNNSFDGLFFGVSFGSDLHAHFVALMDCLDPGNSSESGRMVNCVLDRIDYLVASGPNGTGIITFYTFQDLVTTGSQFGNGGFATKLTGGTSTLSDCSFYNLTAFNATINQTSVTSSLFVGYNYPQGFVGTSLAGSKNVFLPSASVSPAVPYDALVDPTATSPAAPLFTTIFAAAAYCKNTLLLTACSIGVRATTTTITEAGNLTAAPNVVRVEVIGDSITGAGGNGLSGAGLPTWALSTFTDGGFVGTWILEGLNITADTAGSGSLFTSGSCIVNAANCWFHGNGVAGTRKIASGSGVVNLTHCQVFDLNIAATLFAQNTAFYYDGNTTAVWGGNVYCQDCELVVGDTKTLTLQTTGYVIWTGHSTENSNWVGQASSLQGIGNVSIGSFGSLNVCYWDNRPPMNIGTSRQTLNLNISATCYWLAVKGTYNNLVTTGQPTTSTTAPPCQIDAQCFTADITGPAALALTAGNFGSSGTRVTLRGIGHTGHVNINAAASGSDIIFSAVSMSRSTLSMGIHQQAGSVGVASKAYNIDVGSAHNVIVLEADAFDTPGTNLSTTTRIITDSSDSLALPAGPQGPQGPPGLDGQDGADGIDAPVNSQPWNTAWGKIALTTWTTATTTTSATYADITNATLTFTAVPGRQYRYTLRMHALSTIAGDSVGYQMTDGSGNVKGDTPSNSSCMFGASNAHPANTTNTESGISGSVTRKWQGARRAGTGSCQLYADGTFIASFLVEDIGPS
jgi:hypothetical protein